MKPELLTELLRDTMRDNPKGSEKEIRDACRERLTPAMQDALFDYWFGNSYRDYVVVHIAPESIAMMKREPTTRTHSGAPKPAEVERVKTQMLAALMDFRLSDGTALRFATFGQCAVEGGWLTAVSKRGSTNEVVGKKLTEVDLRNLRMRNENAA